MDQLETKEIAFFVLTLIVSCVIAWLTQPLFHGNEPALNTIVTIISILSGFSLLVISQLGDVSLLPKGKSNITKETRIHLKQKFVGQKVLYFLYVTTLLLAILTTLTVKSRDVIFLLHIALEYVFIMISVLCLFFSFKLPSIVEEINDFKFDVTIENQVLKDNKIADEVRNAEILPNEPIDS